MLLRSDRNFLASPFFAPIEFAKGSAISLMMSSALSSLEQISHHRPSSKKIFFTFNSRPIDYDRKFIPLWQLFPMILLEFTPHWSVGTEPRQQAPDSDIIKFPIEDPPQKSTILNPLTTLYYNHDILGIYRQWIPSKNACQVFGLI